MPPDEPEDEPEDERPDGDEPADPPRCPRCGGKPAARRLTTKLNPFLPKVKHLTCSDCGLDYGLDGKAVRP